MQIDLEISEEQIGPLERALKRCRFDNPQQTAKTLAQLAISSWIDWLSGEKRYTSLTQQYID